MTTPQIANSDLRFHACAGCLSRNLHGKLLNMQFLQGGPVPGVPKSYRPRHVPVGAYFLALCRPRSKRTSGPGSSLIKWRAGAVAYLYRPRQWRRSPSPLSQGPALHWMGGNFDVLSSWAMECLGRFIGPVRADVLGRPSGHMASRFAYSARRRKDRSRNYANDDRESCGAR